MSAVKESPAVRSPAIVAAMPIESVTMQTFDFLGDVADVHAKTLARYDREGILRGTAGRWTIRDAVVGKIARALGNSGFKRHQKKVARLIYAIKLEELTAEDASEHFLMVNASSAVLWKRGDQLPDDFDLDETHMLSITANWNAVARRMAEVMTGAE